MGSASRRVGWFWLENPRTPDSGPARTLKETDGRGRSHGAKWHSTVSSAKYCLPPAQSTCPRPPPGHTPPPDPPTQIPPAPPLLTCRPRAWSRVTREGGSDARRARTRVRKVHARARDPSRCRMKPQVGRRDRAETWVCAPTPDPSDVRGRTCRDGVGERRGPVALVRGTPCRLPWQPNLSSGEAGTASEAGSAEDAPDDQGLVPGLRSGIVQDTRAPGTGVLGAPPQARAPSCPRRTAQQPGLPWKPALPEVRPPPVSTQVHRRGPRCLLETRST